MLHFPWSWIVRLGGTVGVWYVGSGFLAHGLFDGLELLDLRYSRPWDVCRLPRSERYWRLTQILALYGHLCYCLASTLAWLFLFQDHVFCIVIFERHNGRNSLQFLGCLRVVFT